MRRVFLALCCGACAAVLTGCTFFKDNRATVRAHIAGALKVAYDAGGASLVATRVDALVAEGHRRKEQASA